MTKPRSLLGALADGSIPDTRRRVTVIRRGSRLGGGQRTLSCRRGP